MMLPHQPARAAPTTACDSFIITACDLGGFTVYDRAHDMGCYPSVVFACTTRREALEFIDKNLVARGR